ncbi:hypothetical protein PKO111_119 [Klebsiella phage PKO111]|jgi:hypothetical protein|uniref:Molybdenum ABC transporter n=1 Tax=Klebsiella phage PKO111 TaxID=1654928 RepID=A0A159B7W9_9CAUD|nr:hypothetical protein BI014_gp119 [Klebsiella phage PKO111]AKJ73180.1 hypothetical protein PKO111_119 [Klebsiella phage PKO111]
MDLFEMMAQDVVEDTPDRSKELQDELDIIIQRHGISVPLGVLEDLASYYLDPPPWSPWAK